MKILPVEYVESRRKYVLFKNDCGVTDVARRGGIYEKYIYDYLENNKIQLVGKTIIDIGANFGFHTIEFASLVSGYGTVWAFEPQRVVFQQLCGNIVLNGFSNVYAYNIALGNRECYIQLEIPDYFSEETINIGNIHTDRWTQVRSEMVEMKTLDSFGIFAEVGVIKIDAQGYEPYILDGAIETIKRNKPLIFIEIEEPHLQAYGFKKDDVIERLERMNYRVEKLHPDDHIVEYVAIYN